MSDAASEVYGLGERAMARATDPDTSHDAAASISEGALRDSQRFVWQILKWNGPRSDTGISGLSLAQYSDSRLRTARCELVRKGLVRDSGRRERTPSGRWAAIWELVPSEEFDEWGEQYAATKYR